jgi:hypothetical protein
MWTGTVLTLGGTIATIAAFSYDTSCPAGYTTHTFQGLPTQCVYVSQYGSDVREQPTTATLERPGMLYGGIGAAAVGLIVLLSPRSAKHAPSISFTPRGWKASKTLTF